jgi:hypothetical protein
VAGALKRLPPYLSYRTFRSFLDSVGVAGVPNRIGRSLMASKSGSTQALLLTAIRYLGLASEKGVTSPELERLVHAEGKERQDVWRGILEKAYPAFFSAKINLERTTTEELAEIFTKEGVSSPDTVRKCVTFFSLAAKDAGIKLSPHIKPYAGARQSARRARVNVEDTTGTTTGSSPLVGRDRNGLSEWELLLSKFPDFDPAWPEDLRSNWLVGFERLSRILGDAKTPS